MFIKRWYLLFATLSLAGLFVIGLPGNGYAAERPFPRSSRPSAAVIGTWRSAQETLTFNANGTAIYQGKRYYYAVSTGGTIQLTGKHGNLTIPYRLAGGKLTLTVKGKSTVYTRRR